LCIKFIEGKGPLGRPRQKWEDNVKMDHKEIGWWVGGTWTGVIWLRTRTSAGLL